MLGILLVPAVVVNPTEVTVGFAVVTFPPTPKVGGGGPGMEKLPKSLYIFGHVRFEYSPGIETSSSSDGWPASAPLTLTCLWNMKVFHYTLWGKRTHEQLG